MTIKEVKDFIFKNYYRQIGYIINWIKQLLLNETSKDY